MERRFKRAAALTLAAVTATGFLPAAYARSEMDKKIEANAAEGLRMITDRMKSLSSSLNDMPRPPRLNQTLQIPVLATTSLSMQEKSENKKSQ